MAAATAAAAVHEVRRELQEQRNLAVSNTRASPTARGALWMMSATHEEEGARKGGRACVVWVTVFA